MQDIETAFKNNNESPIPENDFGIKRSLREAAQEFISGHAEEAWNKIRDVGEMIQTALENVKENGFQKKLTHEIELIFGKDKAQYNSILNQNKLMATLSGAKAVAITEYPDEREIMKDLSLKLSTSEMFHTFEADTNFGKIHTIINVPAAYDVIFEDPYLKFLYLENEDTEISAKVASVVNLVAKKSTNFTFDTSTPENILEVKAFGKLLGYPEQAVDGFIRHSILRDLLKKQADELNLPVIVTWQDLSKVIPPTEIEELTRFNRILKQRRSIPGENETYAQWEERVSGLTTIELQTLGNKEDENFIISLYKKYDPLYNTELGKQYAEENLATSRVVEYGIKYVSYTGSEHITQKQKNRYKSMEDFVKDKIAKL